MAHLREIGARRGGLAVWLTWDEALEITGEMIVA